MVDIENQKVTKEIEILIPLMEKYSEIKGSEKSLSI